MKEVEYINASGYLQKDKATPVTQEELLKIKNIKREGLL